MQNGLGQDLPRQSEGYVQRSWVKSGLATLSARKTGAKGVGEPGVTGGWSVGPARDW